MVVGKIGKISNFGAVGDGNDKGNLSKVGKISNFGAVGDGSDKDGTKITNFTKITLHKIKFFCWMLSCTKLNFCLMQSCIFLPNGYQYLEIIIFLSI